MADRFDLVILGSGSTAFAAALTAQELGRTAVMTEERTIGGTCVNPGCLPSKNLIEAAKLLHDARQPRYPGLTAAPLGLDFAALVGAPVLVQYPPYDSRAPCRGDPGHSGRHQDGSRRQDQRSARRVHDRVQCGRSDR